MGLNAMAESFDETSMFEQIDAAHLEVEEADLNFLCGLLQSRKPKKILKAGNITHIITDTVLGCLHNLQIDSQTYSIDALEGPDSKHLPEAELDGDADTGDPRCFKNMDGMPLLAALEEIGYGIDFLILDAAYNMPKEILNFIAVFPYLTADAVIVLQDVAVRYSENGREVATSVLFQNVTAAKLNHQEQYPNVRDRMAAYVSLKSFCDAGKAKVHFVSNMISAFQLDAATPAHMSDMFAALWIPWTHVPNVKYLIECETLIRKSYGTECLKLFRQAVADRGLPMLSTRDASHYSRFIGDISLYDDFLRNMAQSILGTFPQILLYGKGTLGRTFLHFAAEIGIGITGFVVSDGRPAAGNCEGLPIYPYSQIPFKRDEFLIIQTVDSAEIEARLKKSGFHWMKLPDNFWMKKRSEPGLLLDMLE